jgi:membrane-anchored mycosin MYCP
MSVSATHASGRVLAAIGLGLAASLTWLPGAAAAAPANCGPSFSNPLSDTPWPLRRLRPELAWPLTTGAGVTVAVIDSGVSTTHPSLRGQVLRGKDFVQPGGVGDCDEVAHGTFVAGIIAGLRLPNSGFYGVAPGAKILPIRVLRDDQKSFDASLPGTIAEAIDYAVDQGAKVINLSLVTQPTPALANAVNRALASNVVLVAAAGNDGAAQGGGKVAYPAAIEGVIAVAGIDESDRHVATSTPGAHVDVAAPGTNIEGPAPQGNGFGVRAGGGTSFAAAYVSGMAALIRSYYPDLPPERVAARITGTADHPPSGRDDEVGYGVVNPYRAVTAIGDASPDGRVIPGTVAPGAAPARGLSMPQLAAVWTSVALAIATVAVYGGMWVTRRGRRRAEPPVVATRSAPSAAAAGGEPATGSRLDVRGPTTRREPGSRAIAAVERRTSMPATTSAAAATRVPKP